MSPQQSLRNRYLAILELSDDATHADIRKAYRTLCMIWHPDRAPDHLKGVATEKLKSINEAHSWLAQNLAPQQSSQSQEAKREEQKHEEQRRQTNTSAANPVKEQAGRDFKEKITPASSTSQPNDDSWKAPPSIDERSQGIQATKSYPIYRWLVGGTLTILTLVGVFTLAAAVSDKGVREVKAAPIKSTSIKQESHYDHVFLDENGRNVPAPGFTWLNPDDPKDKRVVENVGYPNTHLNEDGTREPDRGFIWVNPDDPKDKRVKLDTFALHETFPRATPTRIHLY